MYLQTEIHVQWQSQPDWWNHGCRISHLELDLLPRNSTTTNFIFAFAFTTTRILVLFLLFLRQEWSQPSSFQIRNYSAQSKLTSFFFRSLSLSFFLFLSLTLFLFSMTHQAPKQKPQLRNIRRAVLAVNQVREQTHHYQFHCLNYHRYYDCVDAYVLKTIWNVCE